MPKILVVDDDAMIGDLLVRMLAAGGHQASAVTDGQAALSALAADPVDLMISDLAMPGITGRELIRHVRQLYPGINVIAMSGGARLPVPGDVHQDLKAELGVDCLLHKPFQLKAVLQAVRQAILREPPDEG